MKMENIAIIFALIMIPITLVFSAIMRNKMNALKLEMEYTKVLNTATYDAIKALEDNTSVYYINQEYITGSNIEWSRLNQNPKPTNFFLNYSTVADSLKRSAEAMINTFLNGISLNLGTSTVGKETYKANIPALVVVMYNGYYIYSPETSATGGLDHTLKPFAFYSEQYGNLVVNYSLDDFVTVFGAVPPGKSLAEPYSGYIVDLSTIDAIIGMVNDDPATTEINEKQFYKDAKDFTIWFRNLGLRTQQFSPNSIIGNSSTFNIETFQEEKRAVIQNTINTSLAMAMANYNNIAPNTEYVFKIPNLSETDWDRALSNISIITFLQGMPIGTKYYNNYSIATSTESRTSFYINKKDIFFEQGTGTIVGQTMYHRIDCPDAPTPTGANASKYYWEMYEGIYNPSIVNSLGNPEDPYKLTSGTAGTATEAADQHYFTGQNLNKTIRKLFPRHFVGEDGGTLVNGTRPIDTPRYVACSCIYNQNSYPRNVDADGIPLDNAKKVVYYQALAKVLTMNDKYSKRFNFK